MKYAHRVAPGRCPVLALFALALLASIPRAVRAQQTLTSPAPQATTAPSPAYVPAGQTVKYATDVQALLDLDRTSPPPANGILFIGSSIFRQWEQLGTQMAPLPVFNRAFGGSRTWEMLYYMDKVVLPYKPAFVVYYCGSNDVNAKQDAAGIASRIEMFFDRVHKELPRTQVFFATIQKAPDKRAKWAVVDSANAIVGRYADAHAAWVHTIDFNAVLLDRKGALRSDLFKPDSLHFFQPVYTEFTGVIKPVLEKAWSAR
jgi:hypothetical protein